MNNAELITALRTCARQTCCDNCPRYTDPDESAIACAERTLEDAADALEAAEAWEKAWTQKCERLEKRIAELEAQMPKWISVDERLPEESGGYIAYIQEPHMIQKADWEEQYDFSFAMQLWFDKQKMLWSDNGEDSYNAYLPAVDTDNAFHVTHWMKLPEPPKGEHEGDR